MKSTGVVPDQVPVSAVSVWPSTTGPVMAGTTVSCGGAASTAGVAAEGSLDWPPSLMAVTTTTMAWPMSSGPSM